MYRNVRLVGAALLLFLSLALASPAQDDKPKAAPDPKKVAEEDKRFEGEWTVVQMIVGGTTADKEALANMTFRFTGKKYVQKVGETVVEAGMQYLDPTKLPRTMDIDVTEGDTAGQRQLAIYEFVDDDTVRIVAAQHGDKTRPAKLESKSGSDHMLFVLKRKK